MLTAADTFGRCLSGPLRSGRTGRPHLVRAGALSIDLTDPIHSAVVVTHRRNVLNDAVWQPILDQISLTGPP
ncbi:hypothetical protein [Dactylosporangium sp. NPDC005555]|uniref:hypothetical protein n=1 Tax=Dactylosporangium sp. NPDC005555 TaxID=3154889 RepID=UPI0033B95ECA